MSLGPLRENELKDIDTSLFVGSSRKYMDGILGTGWAVVDGEGRILGRGKLTGDLSAQAVELVALKEALHMAEGKRANINTDSRYGFGVVHNYMVAWSRRGYVTLGGGHVQHEAIVKELVEAAKLPLEAAVIKVEAHQKVANPIELGNQRVDKTAKEAAATSPGNQVAAAAIGPKEVNMADLQRH
ncbi:ribonuclease H-like [Carcharodon carcharias]|uniref:ribonuclease H-like n=1 Tax=Carcharodon carcharias TaxID=13397 RepID=UPI001B7F390E|nr:ribonuclease H-like [Carcharodon carcharias]